VQWVNVRARVSEGKERERQWWLVFHGGKCEHGRRGGNGSSRGVPESQLAQSEVVLEISPALKDIKAVREWEQGTTWEGGDMMASSVALVKVALLMLMALAVASVLLLLLLLFEPLITGTVGHMQGVAL
jgi:hypothetical protein